MYNTQCFHCGNNCGKVIKVFEEKSFCCNGCKTVYEIFSENDLTCYYDLQSSPGAIPLMTTAVYLGKFLNTSIKQRIQKAILVFVVVIGLLFILRGLGLGIPYLSPAPIMDMVSSAAECH